MNGVLNVLKPPGMTSHDVVAWIRHRFGLRRVGHAGTLDPGAAGVLVLCLGPATRLAEWLAADHKAYRAEVGFGRATDTLDDFGVEVARADASALTDRDVVAAGQRFVGTIDQVPPMVSAVKQGGRRLYELARQGVEVERAARRVEIRRLDLLAFAPGVEAVARFDVACSKGTYIRCLAADLGQALGLPAYLRHLVRTASGPFRLANAVTLEELAAATDPSRLVMPPAAAMAHLPAVRLEAAAAARVRTGTPPAVPSDFVPTDGSLVALLGADAELLAIAEYQPGPPARLKLCKVMASTEGPA